MGDYTALHLAVELRRDTPEEVIQLLKYMTGQSDNWGPLPDVVPCTEPLFKAARWNIMLRAGSAYHPFSGSQGNGIAQPLPGNDYELTVLSSFKCYDGEIEKFVAFIRPYIHPCNFNWIGYTWDDNTDEPKPLYWRES